MSKGFFFSKHQLALVLMAKSCLHDKNLLLLWYLDGFCVFLYKSHWIISNYWVNPSRKISSLIRRIFEVRNSISEKCIESFCNFLFIIYVFILFNQHYFWRINRLVWTKRLDRFSVTFIVRYMLFVQTTIILLISISLECNIVISLFVIISSVFFNFFFKEFIPKSCFLHNCFRKTRFIIEDDCLPQISIYMEHAY